jgi:hypothetical protein
MAASTPTLGAVAVDYWPQRPAHLIPDGTAQAAAGRPNLMLIFWHR